MACDLVVILQNDRNDTLLYHEVSDSPGPRFPRGLAADRRDGSVRGPDRGPAGPESLKMSHIEAQSINIWLRYDPKWYLISSHVSTLLTDKVSCAMHVYVINHNRQTFNIICLLKDHFYNSVFNLLSSILWTDLNLYFIIYCMDVAEHVAL